MAFEGGRRSGEGDRTAASGVGVVIVSNPLFWRDRTRLYLKVAWLYLGLWVLYVVVTPRVLMRRCCIWWTARKRARELARLEAQLAAALAEIERRKTLGIWTLNDSENENQSCP